MYLSKSPRWLQWLYPSLIWHKNRNDRAVYLTFDDGPVPVVTPHIINILNSFNAKATFFCIGDNVAKYPAVYQEVLANGHRVGNHTFNHLKGWDHDISDYVQNVEACSQLVNSNLFRPPYGRIKRSQIRAITKVFPEMKIFMWDVLSGDFDSQITSQVCVQNVLDNVSNGSIIVFHDSEKAFPRVKEALPIVLQELRKRGFEFRTL